MRFSLRLNNDLPLADYVALARIADAVGLDQLWVSNDLFLRSAPVILAAVAHATRRIELGTGILNPHTVHPAELAMLAATMDELTGDRFNLGLGAGAADFLRWVGITDPHPVRTLRETIDGVRRLLAGSFFLPERFQQGSADGFVRHELYRDPEGRLCVCAGVFQPQQATPVHGHAAWGVVGALLGRPLSIAYRRADDGLTPGFADVIESTRTLLSESSLALVRPGEEDVHRIENPGREPAVTIHVFGAEGPEHPVFDLQMKSIKVEEDARTLAL